MTNRTIIAELHDYMTPEVGRKVGMPLDDFIEKAWAQLAEGRDLVIVGGFPEDKSYLELVNKRRDAFEGLSDILLGHLNR